MTAAAPPRLIPSKNNVLLIKASQTAIKVPITSAKPIQLRRIMVATKQIAISAMPTTLSGNHTLAAVAITNDMSKRA